MINSLLILIGNRCIPLICSRDGVFRVKRRISCKLRTFGARGAARRVESAAQSVRAQGEFSKQFM